MLYPTSYEFIAEESMGKKVLYPITKFIVDEEETKDFSFVIQGNSYVADYLSGEALYFIVDWGDGTESTVNSTEVSQRTHAYSANQEWTITIKNYVSGWINFALSTQRKKLIKILTPFPQSNTRLSFYNCFYGCTSLISIPKGLFENNPNVNTYQECFRSCTSLTSIPEKLFDNNPHVTNFDGCFCQCPLTSIPEGLFDKCLNVFSYRGSFEKCASLTSIPDRLFDKCLNVNYFNMCFADCVLLTGYAPELWLRANPTPSGLQCFKNSTALSNYSRIPSNWK